jgi:branched-subunit amino acid transport protein
VTDLGILPLVIAAAAGTFAARAVPLFAPGVDRLPPIALAYLRMIGPAALGGIAAKEIFLRDGVPNVGPEAAAVIAGALTVRLRGSLAIAMVVSVAVVLALRATISA